MRTQEHLKCSERYADIKRTIGKEIKKARVKKKLTQEEAYEKGISTKRVIKDIEAGKGSFRLEYILDLCTAYDIDIMDLLSLLVEQNKK